MIETNPERVDLIHRKRTLASLERILASEMILEQDQRFIGEALQYLQSPPSSDDMFLHSLETKMRISKCLKAFDRMTNKSRSEREPSDERPKKSFIPTVGKVTKATDPLPSPKPDEDVTSTEQLQVILQAKKEMHARELQREQAKKDGLLGEIVTLTGALKQSTLGISQSVRDQNQKLELIQHYAVQNEDELEQQKKILTERRKAMQYSLFANLTTILWVVALFVLTYIIIRLFPRPPFNNTCANSPR